jgi:hypothetical protein
MSVCDRRTFVRTAALGSLLTSVASFSNPSTPLAIYRRRQRRTVSTLLPVAAEIATAVHHPGRPILPGQVTYIATHDPDQDLGSSSLTTSCNSLRHMAAMGKALGVGRKQARTGAMCPPRRWTKKGIISSSHPLIPSSVVSFFFMPFFS